MNCKKCGAILAPDVKFCANCGSSVEGDAQTAQLQGEYPSSFVTLTPKPKSRIKPVAIAAGAVAAVGVIGAVIGLNFQSGIKQTFMGKEKYARSVLDNTVETFVGAPSSAATGARPYRKN